MSWWLLLSIALKSLSRNKLRSLLTMLGVVIGVAAVISVFSIGAGASQELEKRVASLGVNTIHVHAGSRRRRGVSGGRGSGEPLTLADWSAVDALESVRSSCPMVEGPIQAVYGSANWAANFLGTTPDYFSIRDWTLRSGRFFTNEEVGSFGSVCLLGAETAEKLFGAGDPIGEKVRLKHISLTVIGVLEAKGENSLSSSPDSVVVMPVSTCLRHLRRSGTLNYLSAKVDTAAQVVPVQAEIIALLNQRHRLTDPDRSFQAYNQVEINQMAQDNTRDMVNFLGAVAAVSLVVGGVGIMNIMLVTVNERRREIGIRLALGARARDIRRQFLVEAVVLALLGGAFGIVAGVVISLELAEYSEWPAVFTPVSILLGLAYSWLVGIVSGVYPAVRAARLDPIEALAEH